MIFVPIAPERIPFEWERIAELLSKAVALDEDATLTGLYRELVAGRSEAFWIGIPVHVRGIGVLTMSDKVCWLNYVSGKINGGPKRFVRAARDVVAEIEKLAREAGCEWLVMGGRNWSRVFPEWEHFDPEHPNRMRKPLDG